jgi:tRNA/tmRNA/rRNA uracil-C5-methylase (TrmA/RlmC/RlmD family)
VESAAAGAAGQPGDAGREDLIDLEAGDVANGGWCVARQPDGRVVFVRHALPGERVRARLTDTTAKFARAEAVEIMRASPDRVGPACPHARPGGCGGCDWQHASLAAQRRLKADVIMHQLRRIAGLDTEVTVEPLAGDDGGLGWRTRIRFSVGPDGTAGLLRHRSHQVVDVGDCPIAHPLVNQVAVSGQHWDQTGSVEVMVSPASGESAVIITPQTGPARSLALPAGVPAGRAGAVLARGPGGRLTPLRGRGYLHQHAAGRTWRVGAGTFWQVHPGAADTLATAVLQALEPGDGEVALDLFCGAGLFAGVLAGAVGPQGTVIGVEGDRGAVRDARHNLRAWPWARVHHGDVAATLARQGWPEAGLAVLDPPRAGAGRAVIGHLLRPAASRLRRVAYVSCDPATLARDIAVFAEFGWKLAALRAFDAFPMTHHVECLATLSPA